MRGSVNKAGEDSILGRAAPVIAAAHELKSPLTLITYIAQILGDKTLNLTEQERLQYIERLQMVSERALRLTQQLTVSYRLEDSQSDFSFGLEPVNANAVCEAVLHELTPYANEYEQRLQWHTNGRPRVVVANREILHDVVVNLVDNAIRHNLPKTDVAVSADLCNGVVRVGVHDNGQAVNVSEFLRLRRTLGKSPQPLKNHAGTSGLGLYIVGQFVGAMGGSLGVGRAKQGSTFFVDLLRSKQLRLW